MYMRLDAPPTPNHAFVVTNSLWVCVCIFAYVGVFVIPFVVVFVIVFVLVVCYC